MAAQGVEPIVAGILNSLTFAVAVLDQAGQVAALNDAWRAGRGTLGYHHAAIEVGADYLVACDRATDPDAAVACTVAAGIRDVIAGRKSECQFEYSCPSPGDERAVAFRATPVMLAGGPGAVVAYLPVDSAGHAEDRPRVSARSRALAQSTLQVGDWLIRSGMAPYFSDEMFRLHNLDSSAAGADGPAGPAVETFLRQIHSDDRDRVRATGERFLQQGPGSITCVYRTDPSAGPVRMLEARATTAGEAADDHGEWHGTVLDVTEREQQAAETRQQHKMDSVGRLAGWRNRARL